MIKTTRLKFISFLCCDCLRKQFRQLHCIYSRNIEPFPRCLLFTTTFTTQILEEIAPAIKFSTKNTVTNNLFSLHKQYSSKAEACSQSKLLTHWLQWPNMRRLLYTGNYIKQARLQRCLPEVHHLIFQHFVCQPSHMSDQFIGKKQLPYS